MKPLTLQHGAAVTVRHVRPEDSDLVFEMHTRLSPTSIYNRYLRGYAPRIEAIRGMCQISPKDGAAFVATIAAPGETVIGMAYYIIDADNPMQAAAEPALLVEDRFHMQGVGSYLFRYMVNHARMRGISRFTALISASNEGISRILQQSGLTYSSQYAHGTRDICILLNAAFKPEVEKLAS